MTVNIPAQGRGHSEPLGGARPLSSSKPSHDMRLEYYDILKYLMSQTAKSMVFDDFREAASGLRLQYNMIMPYADSEKLKDVISNLKELNKKIDLVSKSNLRTNAHQTARHKLLSEIRDLLFSVDSELRFAARHLQLPTSAGENMEFSEADFLRDSDL